MEKDRSTVPEGSLPPTVPAEAISQLPINLLKEGYAIRCLGEGVSMSPCIKTGDLFMVKPIAFEEAEIGDVVAFRRDESHSVLTTHRVVQKGKDRGERYLITKGDNNVHRDFPLVSPEDVLGKVVRILRNGRETSLETPFYRLRGYLRARRSLGFWILHVLKERLSL